MPSLSEKDRGNLEAILDASRKINGYVAGLKDADQFFNEEMTFDAVLMNFVVIGEMAAKVSEDLTNSYPEVPWIKVKGFRNIIAHNYFGVDAEEVWQIIQNHPPELTDQIKEIILREEEK